jgi:hypothetical protein
LGLSRRSKAQANSNFAPERPWITRISLKSHAKSSDAARRSAVDWYVAQHYHVTLNYAGSWNRDLTSACLMFDATRSRETNCARESAGVDTLRGDPRKLPVDDAWLPATVVFGWMAFKDSLRTTQILAELIEEIRGKAHLPQETWLDGNPSLKGKIALLEQSRDWIVEKIRAEKLHAYIRTIDPEMRCVPSHDFIGRLTIHPLRGELTSLYSDDDKAHQEASLVVQVRKRSGLTGEVWFSRDELLRLRADTPQAWTPISGCPVGADDSRTRPAPSRPGEVKPPFSKTGAHVLLAARKSLIGGYRQLKMRAAGFLR